MTQTTAHDELSVSLLDTLLPHGSASPLYLDGRWAASESGRAFTVSDPATGQPIADEAEAIRMANDTTYGLASYVYTRDLSRATRVSEALRFGIVGINDINPTGAAAPFGGVGESGLGREGGPQGIDEYLDTKLVGLVL